MKIHNAQYKIDDSSILNYYEVGTAKNKLLLLHAQGTNSCSFDHVVKKLAKHYHVYLVDYYGHGKSSHNPEKYHLVSIGNDIMDFIENVICDSVTVLGHSSGGLIAAYIAAHSPRCTKLILEDPPFFSSWGERRYHTYNYKDLSSVCHNFLLQDVEKDFVYYYFRNQYCWNFFPDESRETVREKLSGFALKYRAKHPDKNLKVLFWPKKFLEGFNGLQYYDPHFGEAFYNDSFNGDVDYNDLLSKIKCKTLFLKANTTIGENGLLQGALSDEDLQRVNALKGIDYLYRHPEARAQDLMDAFRDSDIKAVFNAIGGDDTIRLLPYIDFDVLRNNPKIFTGFSDSTTNHFMMYKAGLVSYYGLSVMNNIAEYVAINEYTKQAMEKTLFAPQERLSIPCSDFCSYEKDKIWWKEENMHLATPRYPNSGYEVIQGSGKVTGELLGGCIDVFPELLGTSLWPALDQWKGKILLIETSEVDMHEMVLSWFLRNLHAQGILHAINGIIVGKPAVEEKLEKYKAVYKQIVGFEANLPDLPILYNVNVGHAYPIGVFPLGLRYEIDCDNKTLTLLESATA